MPRKRIEDLSLDELKKRKKSSALLAGIAIGIFTVALVITILRYLGIGYWGESSTLLPSIIIFMIILLVINNLWKTNKEIKKREKL